MSHNSENVIQEVLCSCEVQINDLLADYKSLKNLKDFEPDVHVFQIGDLGFVALFFDNQENPLLSVLNFEGVIIFTPYFPEENLVN